MSENQKKFFSRSISPFKALKSILGSKMNFKSDTDFSLLGQNFPHFLVRIYSVFWKKNLKQKNSKKFFWTFFLILIFSWKTDKLDPKLAKSITDMCLRHINYFGKKII